MNAAAGRLLPSLALIQASAVAAVFALFLISAPGILLLDDSQTRSLIVTALVVGFFSELVSVTLVALKVRKLRFVLRALALGSRAFEIDELIELGSLPLYVTVVSVASGVGFSSTVLIAPLRPSSFDEATAVSLVLLAVLLIAAAAVPLFSISRSVVAKALELVPVDDAHEAIVALSKHDLPARKVRAHMLAAVVAPTLFVAVGASLIAYAHLRSDVTSARASTAVASVRGALDTFDTNMPIGGRAEALQVIERETNVLVRLSQNPVNYSLDRVTSGDLSVSVPLATGSGYVRFEAPGFSIVPIETIFSVLIVLILATSVGALLGRVLSDDLRLATRQIAQLGNEEVLRGGARIARPARLESVAALGRAVEDLSERFREFADAQERALEAREAALRLRGLLFASVSHDLKSPLNAVLGFCAILEQEQMSESQFESVRIIERRARELLALIENILDAARVEARQLSIERERVDVASVINEAIRRGDDLGPMDAQPVALRVEEGVPSVLWDGARISQAIAALIGHSKRLSPSGGVSVRVRARQGMVDVIVHEPSGIMPPTEVASLLDARNAATATRRSGGLALGLSLARALVEMHGGALDVATPSLGSGCLLIARIPFDGQPPPDAPSVTRLRAARAIG